VPTRQRVSRLAVRDSGGKFLVLHRRAEGTAWLTWPHPPQYLVPLLPHAMLEHIDSAFGSSEVDMLNVPTKLNVHAYGVHATSTSISKPMYTQASDLTAGEVTDCEVVVVVDVGCNY
jgi:hypothetical protein